MKPALAAALAATALAAVPSRAGAVDTYLVAKLGYVAPVAEIAYANQTGTELQPKFYGELGVGANIMFLGLELSAGYLSSKNSNLDLSVSAVPVLLAAKLRLPFPVVSPYVEVGGGAFFIKAEIPGAFSESTTRWGYLVGGGVDFKIASLFLGAEVRWLSADAGIPNLTLRVDSVTATANVGLYL